MYFLVFDVQNSIKISIDASEKRVLEIVGRGGRSESIKVLRQN